MSDILRQVDEDLRKDRLLGLWKKYGYYLIGIIAILIRVFSNQDPDSIMEAKTDFIDKIGLKNHLSPIRANGLLSMIKELKMYAVKSKTKSN